ncbi:MAG: LysM peptidoglycan-binding domain-containing protein [Balneolaceae bacterium]|nr:LysM peptidoglycan-binding domain-containing protein [Balneolaceae bacterium]
MKLSNIFKTGLFTLLCIVGATLTVQAQQKTHQVQAGETLFSIAKEYNITVQDLRDWNNLEGNELRVGQSLIVEGDQSTEDTTTHVVEAQETLFSISKRYGVSIPELKSWNNLSDNNLTIGQELIIYTNGDNGGDNTNKSIVVKETAQRNTYYTVKSGDTLYEIARAHNMTVTELKALNDLSSNNIAIGQELTVKETAAPPSVAADTKSSPQGKFITYTLTENQSLDNILSRFEMDKDEFEALNPGISSTQFQRGQKLTVLAPPSKSYENPYIASADLKNLGKTAVAKYSSSEVGKPTTSGELYNPGELTAAHSNIAIGTVMFIENPVTNKGIYVRINDRISGSGLKLSDQAWASLNFSSSNPSVNIYQDQ